MNIETTHIFTLTSEEQKVISNFMTMINECSLPLNDIDCMNILRAISNKDTEVDEFDEPFIINYDDENKTYQRETCGSFPEALEKLWESKYEARSLE